MDKSSQESAGDATVEAGTADAFVSRDAGRWQIMSPLKKLILVAATVVVLAIAGIVVYFLFNKPDTKPAPAAAVTVEDNVNYSLLSGVELDQEFKRATGQDIAKITDDDIDKDHFTTFYAAYAAAQIYAVKHDYKKSQEAYAVAAAETDKTTTYEFYLGYIAVADFNGDKTLSNQLTEKAKAFISADTHLDKQQKQDLLDEIAQKQKLKEQSD